MGFGHRDGDAFGAMEAGVVSGTRPAQPRKPWYRRPAVLVTAAVAAVVTIIVPSRGLSPVGADPASPAATSTSASFDPEDEAGPLDVLPTLSDPQRIGGAQGYSRQAMGQSIIAYDDRSEILLQATGAAYAGKMGVIQEQLDTGTDLGTARDAQGWVAQVAVPPGNREVVGMKVVPQEGSTLGPMIVPAPRMVDGSFTTTEGARIDGVVVTTPVFECVQGAGRYNVYVSFDGPLTDGADVSDPDMLIGSVQVVGIDGYCGLMAVSEMELPERATQTAHSLRNEGPAPTASPTPSRATAGGNGLDF